MASRWAACWSNWAASIGGKDGKFPSLADPEPAYHGLKFYENFGDFAFTTKARAVALARFRSDPVADERFPDADRHRKPARPDGPACRECEEGRRISRRPQARRLGVLCRAEDRAPITNWRRNTCRKDRARCSPSASRAATTPAQAGRQCAAVLASRQYRRHPQPDPASGLDHPPPADRGAAARRRRRPRRRPPVDRPGGRRRPDPRPRRGAGGGNGRAYRQLPPPQSAPIRARPTAIRATRR